MSETSDESLDMIEERLSKLESLVGKFDQIDQTKGLDVLMDISNKLKNKINSNPKLASAVKLLDDIKKYSNVDVLSEIENEHAVNAKIDLILLEEDYLRKLNQDYEQIKVLSKVLDNKSFDEIPSLTQKLTEVSAQQASIMQNQDQFSEDLKQYLAIYYNTMKSVNDTITGLNEYLNQFEKPSQTSKNTAVEEDSNESNA